MCQIFPFAGFTQLFYKNYLCYRLHPPPSLRFEHLSSTMLVSSNMHMYAKPSPRKKEKPTLFVTSPIQIAGHKKHGRTRSHIFMMFYKQSAKLNAKLVCVCVCVVCVFYSIPKNLIDTACDTSSVRFSFNFSLWLQSCEYDHTLTVT